MIRRALILGAGGPAASSWATGVIAGLADQGIDIRNADLFVGTSAGSRVAAQITSGQGLEELFERQLQPQPVGGVAVKVDFKKLKADYVRAKEGDGGDIGFLKRMGSLAVNAPTVSEADTLKEVASRLLVDAWPVQRVLAVAVDTETGERRAFDRSSGVPLRDAVAASGAAPGMSPAITIEGHRYMDGGVYSTDNADLAMGFERVLILTLKAGFPSTCVVSLDAAVERLERSGSQVVTVRPDDATEAAFAAVGGNLLDPKVQDGAARAGREQGRRIAALNVAAVWN
ncbi:MAG TPA: patatin-like phospholipase family protein [Gemmatimonadaceae bacterium]|nr:patatin-like phospholipase family protein [Gemmatimonadaceae bacterium]